MATFLVQSKLRLAHRPGRLYLVGEIVSGTIRAGMVVSGRAESAALNVLGVEFVDRPRGTSQVALHVDFEDPKGQESVDALFGEGDMIEVIEPHAEEPKGGA